MVMADEKSEAGIMVCFGDNMTKKEIQSLLDSFRKKLEQKETLKGQGLDVESGDVLSEASCLKCSCPVDKEKDRGKKKKRKMKKPSIEPGEDDCSKFVALDCEFVGVGSKKLNALGRCSIVDYSGNILLDMYCKPDQAITDYRTPWSGIRPKDLKNASSFTTVQNRVRKLIQGKILVGHAIFNDLTVLKIRHPKQDIRDTSHCKILKDLANMNNRGRPIGLKKLAKALLNRTIQRKSHCSVEDSQVTMELFKLSQVHKPEYEERASKRMNSDEENFEGNVKVPKIDCDDPERSLISDAELFPLSEGKKRERRHSFFADHYWPEDVNCTLNEAA